MLLARMAKAMYWTGRYLERAEDMARVIRVHGDTHVDLPVGEDVGWRPLLAIAGVEDGFLERYHARGEGDPDRRRVWAMEDEVVEFLLHDESNPVSVLASVTAARDNLRTARPLVTREVWESCNDLWLALSDPGAQAAARVGRGRWLRRVVGGCQHINGVLWGTMRRDEALAFLRIGQSLERIDLTCRVLGVRADSVLPGTDGGAYEDVRWMATLRSLAAYQPFRRAMPMRQDDGSTLRFLLQDDLFPRAVAACLGEVLELVKPLSANEQVVAACRETAVLIADAPVPHLDEEGLRQLMGEVQHGVAAVDGAVEASYFNPAVAAEEEPDPAEFVRILVSGSTLRTSPTGRISAMQGRRVYRVMHRTTYEYEPPVEQSFNSAHLRPRDTDRQQCLSHTLEIDPIPATATEHLDTFGNYQSTFLVTHRHERLSVISTSEVMVAPTGEPPVGPSWETARRLLETDRQPASRAARRFRLPSRFVPLNPVLEDYASESFAAGRPLVEAVGDLTSRIHRDFVYDPGFSSVTTPLMEVFEHRRGVCQDFAHLVLACVRAMGFAARYVSGYIETVPPPGQARMVGADASHAWASVYLPGWGWFDVDPTNDRPVAESHVTTAWGQDYWDISPLRGTVEGGGSTQRLDVAVDVVHLVAEPAG